MTFLLQLDWSMETWQTRMLAAHAAIFLSAMLAVVMSILALLMYPYMAVMMRRPEPVEVILIEESPIPTRSWSSPWPLAPNPTRRRRSPASFRGGMRRRGHARHTTLLVNPYKAHHCAYECVLRMSKRRVSMACIKELRAAVAQIVLEWFRNDTVVCGVP